MTTRILIHGDRIVGKAVALAELLKKYPDAEVVQMPHPSEKLLEFATLTLPPPTPDPEKGCGMSPAEYGKTKKNRRGK